MAEFETTAERLGATVEAAVGTHPVVRLLNPRLSVKLEEFDPAETSGTYVPCAFLPDRRRVYDEIGQGLGMRRAEPLIDPHAIVARSSRIGDGTFINTASVVGASTMIGDCVFINRTASVSHHVILADFVSIGPSVTLASNVRVGEGTLIGTGAVILPDVTIGAGCIIAGGAVVRSSVPDDSLVAGEVAKARPMRGKRARFFSGEQE